LKHNVIDTLLVIGNKFWIMVFSPVSILVTTVKAAPLLDFSTLFTIDWK